MFKEICLFTHSVSCRVALFLRFACQLSADRRFSGRREKLYSTRAVCKISNRLPAKTPNTDGISTVKKSFKIVNDFRRKNDLNF